MLPCVSWLTAIWRIFASVEEVHFLEGMDTPSLVGLLFAVRDALAQRGHAIITTEVDGN